EFNTYTTLPDGHFEVTLELPPGEWLYQYLATFGAHCEILSPPSLREEMRRRLEENLKVYSYIRHPVVIFHLVHWDHHTNNRRFFYGL
ncbi:WYL domain-containing protein, partial [Eubacterium aggregans]|uniref:WYL domain-containing protein n=1 Tax=Eubacterium aggregans TaxID=81409 RepID=UPI003F3ED2FF